MIRRQLFKLLYARRQRAVRQYKTLNWIKLDHAAVLHNVALLQRQHPGFGIIPVLKSNAYGHGLRDMAQILNAADCESLAVDGYFEASRIRHLTRHRILVLGYILPENVRLLDTRHCSFVVQDIAGLKAFGRLGRPVRIHLELNTGMNRLGLQPAELDGYLATLKQFPHLELEGVMSHLADADNEADDTFTAGQTAQFDKAIAKILTAGFHPRSIHLAQTAGSTKAHSRYANALRFGIGLYGISPLSAGDPHAGDLAGLRPVLSLKTTIIKTIELQKGDRVSYNGIFTAPHAMRLGVLPLGYYEGVPRALSSCGILTAADGQLLPIRGRVCMNHTMIDLGETSLQTGDVVTVMSADPAQPNSVARLVADHHLFPYTLLAGLSSSIRRNIV